MSIYLIQMLCPKRHAILAAMLDADADKATDYAQGFKNLVLAAASGEEIIPGAPKINPWCGICGARSDTWTVESAKTPYTSMEQAKGEGEKVQRANLETRAYMDASGQSYDSKRRN